MTKGSRALEDTYRGRPELLRRAPQLLTSRTPTPSPPQLRAASPTARVLVRYPRSRITIASWPAEEVAHNAGRKVGREAWPIFRKGEGRTRRELSYFVEATKNSGDGGCVKQNRTVPEEYSCNSRLADCTWLSNVVHAIRRGMCLGGFHGRL